MGSGQSPGAELRDRIAHGPPLLLPGCADALTARIAVDVGFESVYATGAGISNALLGYPDIGLTTMTEAVDQVRRICEAVDVPVVADIDTGFGNALNARRTMRSFEAAGVAAVQIEDQDFPKRCGHFDGKQVIPSDEMVAKLSAVLDARVDPATIVIARTDALAVEGLDSAVERGIAYAAAGADVVFVEAPPTREVLAALPGRIPAPLVANMVEGGRTPLVALDDLDTMGYRIVLYANTALRAAMLAARNALAAIRVDGGSHRVVDTLVPWDERQRLVGKPEFDALEERYAVEALSSVSVDEHNGILNAGPRERDEA